MDSLEVPLHGLCGAHSSQSRVFLSHHLPQAGAQVFQLLMESSTELLQEGGVPGSRGARCVEEVEALLEHLEEHRDGLGLLQLATLHHLLGESEIFSVLQTEVRREPLHLTQEPQGLSANQHVVLRQVIEFYFLLCFSFMYSQYVKRKCHQFKVLILPVSQ